MNRQHYEQLTENEPRYWYMVNVKNGRVRQTEFRLQDAFSEEKLIALQQCAHKAVAGIYGEDYAKPVTR